MGSTWPKLIRDPVHDIISFENNDWDNLLLELINTTEFQRLRRIKQLGMSEMVFPGANHSRFAHSIGVMHNARRFLARIEQLLGKPVETEHRTSVLAAALLHDLGHGPFSHTFEKITGENHEARTREIILDPNTKINEVLRTRDTKLPEILSQFFDEDPDETVNGTTPEHFIQIVSSQLDADRFDYLLRDAHSTGADYGKFDSRWIIQHLLLDEQKKRLYLSNKAFIAAETYVFARYHMYRAVYFHKTTRAAEVMLRLLFARFKTLAIDGKKPAEIAPGAPAAVLSAFANAGKMRLSDYLDLDDHTVTEFIKACRNGNDSPMAKLASDILDRKLFKAVDATDADPAAVGRFCTAVTELVKKSNLAPETSFIDDSPADTPYKPYDPDAEKPATQIYLQDSLGKIREFAELSDAVKALKEKYTLLRYYFPWELRTAIELIAKEHLRKGKAHA